MRVRNSLGYTEVPVYGAAHAKRGHGYGSPLPFPTMTPAVLPSFRNTTDATEELRNLIRSSPVPEGTFYPPQEVVGARWRPTTPQTLPRGGTPAPAPAVTRMWNVSPAIPEGIFRPTVPPGARFPEVFTTPDGRPNLPGRALPGVVTAPDGRRWYIPPQPRRLPGDMFWLRLLNLLRGGAAPAPSTTAPTNTVLLPAYPFPEGDFGPGTATAEDPERTQVPTDDGKRFPFLAVLLLGGGAFLAYRIVRGKKDAQVKV